MDGLKDIRARTGGEIDDFDKTEVRAVLGLEGGQTALATSHPSDLEEGMDHIPSGGIIFAEDMPSLEAILEKMDVITAVIERPAPKVSAETPRAATQASQAGRGYEAFVVGGVPSAVTAVGLCFLIAGVAAHPIVPNPYVGLYLTLAGIVLAATAIAALRSSSNS